MKQRLAYAMTALCLATVAQAAWSVTVLHPASAYTSFAYGNTISNQVGWANVSSNYHASLWSGSAGSWVDLNPAGATSSGAFVVDGTHQAGYAVVGVQKASLWTGTAGSWVNLTPPGYSPSVVRAMSGSTQVGHVTSEGVQHACKWTGSAASIVDLHPAGSAESGATAIYGSKQFGYTTIATHYHACQWSGTAASMVDFNPAGASGSAITCAGSSGQGGTALFSGDTHAGLWTGSAASFVDLHPAGALLSRISAMAGTYQVGDIIDGSGYNRATLWTGTVASKVDLHALLPADYKYSIALSVAVDGANVYVAGYGYNDTTNREEALLWTQGPPNDNFTLSLNKTQVAGQNSVQGTITMAQVKASNTVFTTYDNSSLVTTPATVTVLTGQTVKNFQITTTAITSTVNTTIYAKRGAITQSKPLTLIPLIPTALAFTPSQVTGGQTTSCKVVINGVAGPSGRVLAILDNSPYSGVPSTVTVPPGGTSVTFNITTTAVTSQKTVTVTARVSAGEKTGNFKINP